MHGLVWSLYINIHGIIVVVAIFTIHEARGNEVTVWDMRWVRNLRDVTLTKRKRSNQGKTHQVIYVIVVAG